MDEDVTDQGSPSPVLVLEHAAKRFGAVRALEDGSITLYPGEAHALLGENGAGKSTLVKILAGVHAADGGRLLLDGDEASNNGNWQWIASVGVDPQPAFRRIFYEELLPDLKRQGKTLIVISHDDRFFGIADRVLRMKDGQLVEDMACETRRSAAR